MLKFNPILDQAALRFDLRSRTSPSWVVCLDDGKNVYA